MPSFWATSPTIENAIQLVGWQIVYLDIFANFRLQELS
jgi:hypothetical protein